MHCRPAPLLRLDALRVVAVELSNLATGELEAGGVGLALKALLGGPLHHPLLLPQHEPLAHGVGSFPDPSPPGSSRAPASYGCSSKIIRDIIKTPQGSFQSSPPQDPLGHLQVLQGPSQGPRMAGELSNFATGELEMGGVRFACFLESPSAIHCCFPQHEPLAHGVGSFLEPSPPQDPPGHQSPTGAPRRSSGTSSRLYRVLSAALPPRVLQGTSRFFKALPKVFKTLPEAPLSTYGVLADPGADPGPIPGSGLGEGSFQLPLLGLQLLLIGLQLFLLGPSRGPSKPFQGPFRAPGPQVLL